MKNDTSRWSRTICWLLVVVFVGLVPMIQAAGGPAKLLTDHASYVIGEPVKVAFTNGPGNRLDWIGIYKADQVPGNIGSTHYLYVDGTTGGATGVANGEVTFTGGAATAGTWTAFLLEDDGYRVLAQDTFVVSEASAPQLRIGKQIYKKGEAISINFSNGKGNPKDWIGIYAEGVVPGPGSLGYRYVDNTTAGNAGRTNGTVQFASGFQTPGKWVAHLLEDDSYTSIASDAFEIVLVGSGLAMIVPDHGKYLPNQPVRIMFDGGRGNSTDWIGVYQLGQAQQVVGSTDWRYVNNKQSATTSGIRKGEIVFDSGFTGSQVWRAFFMLNDGYELVGEATFEVLEAGSPLVQSSKRVYDLNEPIAVSFFNSPGNSKDWIAIYPKGIVPDGDPSSTYYWYTDGTTSGTAGNIEGTVNFTGGLSTQGEWTAFLLENDGYTVLASEDFTVKASGVLPARLVSITPGDGETAKAVPDLRLVLENRDTSVNLSTISVKLDGAEIVRTQSANGSFLTLTATPTTHFPQGSAHTYTVSFKDSVGTANTITSHFTIGTVVNLQLPAPVYFENFDAVVEGGLPSGWTGSNASDAPDIAADMHHLGSMAYANFTVVDSARFSDNFLAYEDTQETATPYTFILGPSSTSFVNNGTFVRQFANSKILFGVSGYRSGARHILSVTTPDINLSGKHNIHLSYTSLYQQNQDSIAGIEVSNDSGVSWHPVIYYLDPPDIIRTAGVVDLDATFNTVAAAAGERAPYFEDGSGGTYGSFLKAPLDADVAAATHGRINDDPQDGTRIEKIRVPTADNQSTVRFRIFYAGTDSWYLGMDDFGVYSIAPDAVATLAVARSGEKVDLNWPELPGYILQVTDSLSPQAWRAVEGVQGHAHSVPANSPQQYFRLLKVP